MITHVFGVVVLGLVLAALWHDREASAYRRSDPGQVFVGPPEKSEQASTIDWGRNDPA
jgi:hypothetical protein